MVKLSLLPKVLVRDWGVEVHTSTALSNQGSRGAEEQRSRGAKEQRRVRTPFIDFGTPFIILGTPFIDFGTPFIVLGTPFIDFGTPFIVFGTPFIVLGTLFIVLGTPFIDLGTPFIVLGTLFIDFGTPFIVLGTPFIVFGTPFIVFKDSCSKFNVCQLLLILPPPVFHLELVTHASTPLKQICGDFTKEQSTSHLSSSIRELLLETQLCLLFG
ncbi:hypothetical protein [Nostoc sp.]|uniref:hypothetical protein n=1 Tax=Nostoc sp. TaxID=1180 RepID=UPI002FF57B0B